MLGMHGTAYANFAVSECDLLIAIGARFDDRVTGKLDEFACDAEVIHIDIDPAEVSKNRCPQLGLVGDTRKILLQVLKKLRKDLAIDLNQTQDWLKRIYKWKKAYPLMLKSYKFKTLSPQETIHFVGQHYKNAFFTTDVGQHQMWSAQLINCQPKKWISSSGLGTMGFGLPSAIGVKVAHPFQHTICISGDSSFQMSIQELATISQYNLGIKMIIVNNGWQGMVRQWQESFYGNRFSNSYMRNGMPNFSEVAKAYGIEGYRIESFEELQNLIFEKSNPNDAMLLDVNVVENENCYPMVAPGRSNSQMLGLDTK
jgi:acetolactate synthase-1/2/3 large subunit